MTMGFITYNLKKRSIKNEIQSGPAFYFVFIVCLHPSTGQGQILGDSFGLTHSKTSFKRKKNFSLKDQCF